MADLRYRFGHAFSEIAWGHDDAGHLIRSATYSRRQCPTQTVIETSGPPSPVGAGRSPARTWLDTTSRSAHRHGDRSDFPPADSWDIITADVNPIQPGRRRERHRYCLREEVRRSTRPRGRAEVRHASGARLSHRQAAGERHGLRRRAGTRDGAPAQVRCPGGKGVRRPRDRRRGVFGDQNREIVGGDGRRQYAPSLASTSSPNRGRSGGFGRDGQSSFGRDLPVTSIRITPV